MPNREDSHLNWTKVETERGKSEFSPQKILSIQLKEVPIIIRKLQPAWKNLAKEKTESIRDSKMN